MQINVVLQEKVCQLRWERGDSINSRRQQWRPTSQSELPLIIFNMDLTHLGSEASQKTLILISRKYQDQETDYVIF